MPAHARPRRRIELHALGISTDNKLRHQPLGAATNRPAPTPWQPSAAPVSAVSAAPTARRGSIGSRRTTTKRSGRVSPTRSLRAEQRPRRHGGERGRGGCRGGGKRSTGMRYSARAGTECCQCKQTVGRGRGTEAGGGAWGDKLEGCVGWGTLGSGRQESFGSQSWLSGPGPRARRWMRSPAILPARTTCQPRSRQMLHPPRPPRPTFSLQHWIGELAAGWHKALTGRHTSSLSLG